MHIEKFFGKAQPFRTPAGIARKIQPMFPEYSKSELDTFIAELLASEWLCFDNLMHLNLPNEGGIYRICDFSKQEPGLMYVGKSNNLRRRLYSNHFNGPAGNSTLRRKLLRNDFHGELEVTNYLQASCKAQYIIVEDERFRCFAEHYAISVLQPQYND